MPVAPALPDLTVEPGRLTFADVWEDSRFPLVFAIHNRGEREAVIEKFISSCGCVGVEPETLAIPAEGSRDVRLTLDLSPTDRDVPGPGRRSFEASVVARLAHEAGPSQERSWTVRGTIRPAIGIAPAVASMGRISERIPPEAAAHIDITAYVPVERIEAECPSNDFGVRVDRSATKPSHFRLTVSPRKGISRGEKTVDIRVTPFGKDGKPLGGRTLPVKAWIVGDVQPSSDGVIFGTQEVGARLEETVSLQSLTGRVCASIDKVTCEGAGLSAEAVPTPKDGNPAVTVRLRVSSAGPCRGKVVASVRMKDGSVEAVELAVSAYGLAEQRISP